MTTEEYKQNRIKLDTGDSGYPRFEISEEQSQQIINNIKDKIPKEEGKHLDISIIEAYLDEILFLGKLKELDKIVKGGREKTGKLVGNLLQKIFTEAESEGELFIKSLQKVIERLNINENVNAYMSEFTGQRFAEEMHRQWSDRLQIWTYSHFMTVMTRAVSDKFIKNKETIPENLKSIGTLFFDLDGLKFLNEVSGYGAGDKALWVMARALTDPALIQWAEKQGIELVPSHHHGDEFLMGVIAEDEIDLIDNENSFIGVNGEKIENVSIMKYIGDYISRKVNDFDQEAVGKVDRRAELTSGQAVSGSVGKINKRKKERRKNQINPPKNIKDIIDFSQEKQLTKLKEFKAQLSPELAKLLNQDFEYQLSCSYGYSVLEDSLAKNMKDGLEFDNENVSYEYLIYKLTGDGLVDTAEAKLKISKEIGREERNNSDNLKLRLLERLYRFGRETGGDDKKFKDLYLQVSRDLIKLEMALKENNDKIKELEVENEQKDKLIKDLKSRLSGEVEALGRMWEWFDKKM